MEIDFLGLNSPKSKREQQSSMDTFQDSGNGGVETSLSLSTSSSFDCQRETLNFCENKETWEFSYKKEACPKIEGNNLFLVSRPVFHPPPTAAFLFDLNDRSIPALPAEPPAAHLTMLYSACPNVFSDNLQEKAEGNLYMTGSSSTGPSDDGTICKRGYTPTVAMARSATLARFLEKRLHRMNKIKTSHLILKSVNGANSEACNTTISRSNKKKNKSLMRS